VIVLDTNVVSEAMKPNPAPLVIEWLDRRPAEEFFLASTSLAELLVGIEILPPGRRRLLLAEILRQSIERFFGPRILPFDQASAQAFAILFARTRARGAAISMGDCQIAAVAQVHGFAVATRDAAPFLAAGLQVIDPWTT
jgi:predicted nucleic acid-binding protein